MNTSLQLDDPNLRLLVQGSSLDIEKMRPPGQAICLAGIVKCVKYLHC